MKYRFSEMYAGVRPSAIRELFKLAANPGMISLHAGSPSADLFPYQQMSSILEDLFRDRASASNVLKYGISEGFGPLRQQISSRMTKMYKTGGDDDMTIITSGALQGVEVAGRVFLDKGDGLVTENPTFSVNSFKRYTSNIAAIDMQPDGLDVDKLEDKLKSDPRIKLLYIIPTFHNPTGYTTSQTKRQQLYDLACKFDLMIIEDDPYLELRFEGDTTLPIKSLDTEGRVIYVGSFSKTLAPGMRVGYVIAPEEVARLMVIGKQTEDLHTNLLAQTLASRFMSDYDFDAHLGLLRAEYLRKSRLMIGCMEASLPLDVEYRQPTGGLFMWCKLPDGYSSEDLFALCLKRNLLITTGASFMVNPMPCNPYFRLNYSAPTDADIERGIAILAESVTELLANPA